MTTIRDASDRPDTAQRTDRLARAAPTTTQQTPEANFRAPTTHPAAWWLWALALATAASRTTNPWLLGIVIAVAGCVVANRRGDEPWANSYGIFLRFGIVVIVIRVFFHALLGGVDGTTVWFTIPEVPLPEWAAGIELGGVVTAEGVLAACYDGLSLATLLCCIGAANALANTKRLLRAAPGALYEISVALVVALSVAPQLVVSARTAYRARALRGTSRRGLRALGSIAVPVLVDALERSLALAAAMDSRGYGRAPHQSRLSTWGSRGLMSLGLVGACLGLYALLTATVATRTALIFLLVGLVVAIGGLWWGSRRVHRTTHRPDTWGFRDIAIVACGVAAPATMITASSLGAVDIVVTTAPLTVPGVPLLPAIGALLAVLPAWLAPNPRMVGPRGAAAKAQP